jgi:hypothetical protein
MVEIVSLYDLIERSRPSNFKSTADIHYCIELCEIATVSNHDPYAQFDKTIKNYNIYLAMQSKWSGWLCIVQIIRLVIHHYHSKGKKSILKSSSPFICVNV